MAYHYLSHCKDALEAEISLLKGMSLSMQWPELPIMIQSDSSIAVVALRDDSLERSAHGHLIVEIKKLLDLRGFVPLKIERKHNRVVHSLAKYWLLWRLLRLLVAPCFR